MVIDDLMRQSTHFNPAGSDLGLRGGDAYASYYPNYETNAPQYVYPNIFTTTQTGFLQNEFVYHLQMLRAQAQGEGEFRVNNIKGETPKEVKNHPLIKLIHNPNENIDEAMFFSIKSIDCDNAGFSAWEIEFNVLGEPLRLWHMLPHWCSFIRGQQTPLKYIRYQPYGLPPMDIPLFDASGKRKVLFFSNPEDYHPLYPGVRFYSPTMHCLPIIETDNAATFFLTDFFKHGAKSTGLLSVKQTIDQNYADDMRRRWVSQHGGAQNWSAPIIMGDGTSYSPLTMNFKDMAFPELDGRAEIRICNAFEIETIVADARVGLLAADYNNKEQATRNWYYNKVAKMWKGNANTIYQQMLPLYEKDTENFSCDFDISHVYAMQDDRTQRWTRAVNAWEKRLVIRNVALKEAGLEEIEGVEGKSYYEVVRLTPGEPVNAEGEPIVPDVAQPNDSLNAEPKPASQKPKKVTPAETEEIKQFKIYAKKRIREDKPQDVDKFEFKIVSHEKQVELIDEFNHELNIKELADAINRSVESEVA